MSTPNDPLIGTTLGKRYQILEKIGEGGMGAVYKARQTFMDEVIALKIIRPELRQDANFLDRFLREVKNAASVRHPNAISILDSGEFDGGLLYMAMEYVEGQDLGEVISQHPTGMKPEMMLYIARQICQALDAVHRKGIVHRDLRPDNVMVYRDDKRGLRVKVLDFGISRAMENTRLTMTGMIIGTPEFMSPEQAAGEPLDQRSDIYSLGLMIYAMLVGRTPFQSTTPHGFLHKQIYEPPTPPRKFRNDLPPMLEQAVLKTLEKKPAARYTYANALLSDLEAAVLGKPAPADTAGSAAPRKKSAGETVAGTDVHLPETMLAGGTELATGISATGKNPVSGASKAQKPFLYWLGGVAGVLLFTFLLEMSGSFYMDDEIGVWMLGIFLASGIFLAWRYCDSARDLWATAFWVACGIVWIGFAYLYFYDLTYMTDEGGAGVIGSLVLLLSGAGMAYQNRDELQGGKLALLWFGGSFGLAALAVSLNEFNGDLYVRDVGSLIAIVSLGLILGSGIYLLRRALQELSILEAAAYWLGLSAAEMVLNFYAFNQFLDVMDEETTVLVGIIFALALAGYIVYTYREQRRA